MSNVDSPVENRWKKKRTYLLAAGGLLLIALLFFWLQGDTEGPRKPRGETSSEENSLAAARDGLAKNTDLNTCRSAVLQINSYLADHPELRPPALSAEQKTRLQETFHFDEGELNEIGAGNYTNLDAYHLELCFMLRDTARSLAVKTPGGGKGSQQTPLDLATAAFAWVMREVRLEERDHEPVPAQYVLRRGWGSAMERAVVFLTLLPQLGAYEGTKTDLTGCLLLVHDKPDAPPRLWACGVLVDKGNNLYLFDPRLGLPLPGPEGKGIATLAAVRKDPSLLAQLTTGEQRYDVAAEQVPTVEAKVVFPLSALSPRMRHLQEKLLPQARVNPATDVADIDRLKAAVNVGTDKPLTVGAWKEGVVLLRQFLPPEEGGADQGFTSPNEQARVQISRKALYEFQLTPWEMLPPLLAKLPPNVGLGQRVRGYFQTPFVQSALEPGNVRDSMIRGRYEKAISKLTDDLEYWRKAHNAQQAAANLDQAVTEWVNKAIPVYAAQLRNVRGSASTQSIETNPDIQALWNPQQSKPILVLLDGAIAVPRLADVLYQLSLCKQDQAEQMQSRLDLQTRTGSTPSPTDVQKAKETWKDAQSWWTKYLGDYPKGPQAAAARRMLGRARAMLGDLPGAVKVWEDLSEPMTPQEKVAALYLARQVQKK